MVFSKMKKIFLSSLILFLSSSTFAANCSITYKASETLSSAIEKEGFTFDNYEKLCQRLKQNNAGVSFSTVSQISPYQTTAAVVISLYPIGKIGMTSATTNWIRYDESRTTNAQKSTLYGVAMAGLNDLADDKNQLALMLKQVSEIRTGIK